MILGFLYHRLPVFTISNFKPVGLAKGVKTKFKPVGLAKGVR
jgi:hypothetical protein